MKEKTVKKYAEFLVFSYLIPTIICIILSENPIFYQFNINVVFVCTSVIGGLFSIKNNM